MKTGKLCIGALCAILTLHLIAVSAFAAESHKKKTLTVGVILRLNDKFNDTVATMLAGIETAKSLYEKKHPGVRIVLKRYPHGDDLESVLKATTRAVEEKVPAVIGGELSEESIVIGDKLAESKAIFITPTSSNPQVTENKPYVFRSCFSDTLVAGQLAHFTVEHLKPAAIGLVHNVSSPYTDFLSKRFIETMKEIEAGNPKKSIPIIHEKVLRDTRDFGPQIDAFIKGGVTHVAMLTHQSDLLKFAMQAADKNFFPVYIGSDGWGSNEHVYKNLVVEPSQKKFVAYRNSYWKQDATTPIATEFRQTYEKNHLRKPNAWSAISFDAAWVLFTSMDKAAKPSDGESIRRAMVAIKDIHLVTAHHFKFGADNSPRKDLYIYKIDRGGINYEATLK